MWINIFGLWEIIAGIFHYFLVCYILNDYLINRENVEAAKTSLFRGLSPNVCSGLIDTFYTSLIELQTVRRTRHWYKPRQRARCESHLKVISLHNEPFHNPSTLMSLLFHLRLHVNWSFFSSNREYFASPHTWYQYLSLLDDLAH